MVLQDEMIEIGMADTNPVFLSKSREITARKADLAVFDTNKLYSRLGIDPDEK